MTKEQLANDTGGPKSLVMLLSMDEVCQELTVQEFIHAVEIERDVREGRGHPVIASVVQLLARRP